MSTVGVSKENASLSEKRRQRAERFGMPVLFSEEEKRTSRAERFGTGSTLPGISLLSVPEEQKRKARAERFGLSIQSIVDDETNKKSRVAKYDPAFIPNAVEDDKRQARALRFSQSSLTSTPHLNEKGEIEPITSVVGKAGF
uniref:THO1-MOS11 C-terminal domain-containing protein n=1 Tax=Kalanchoe fedtschenkoi TaxID=63787 RepID=A0A7N0U4Z6_KALFE